MKQKFPLKIHTKYQRFVQIPLLINNKTEFQNRLDPTILIQFRKVIFCASNS